MSLIRLYLDEDSMNRALLMALRQRDIDVITVSDVLVASGTAEDMSNQMTFLSNYLKAKF